MNFSNMSFYSSTASINTPAPPVESETITFQDIPLTALSNLTLRKLSYLLNSKKILRSEEGYERDWRGLATLTKQKFLCDDNAASGDDPTTKLIQLWCRKNPKTATFAYLEQFLGIMDRWDVFDDVYTDLVQDKKTYHTKLQMSADVNADESGDTNLVNVCDDFSHGSDPNILTTSDVICAQKGLPPQMYDAFVLYADADLNYAVEILTKLEDDPEYNLKLCTKDRDLLAGVQFEHVALTQLIEERCKHLIVVLTEEFLKSPENKFLINYTQAQQIQHATRKIVPLLYEDAVDIPRTLKIYTLLRYNSGSGSLFNFWSKLAIAIQNVNAKAETVALLPTYYRNENTRHLNTYRKTTNALTLPSPPAEIPSISIIPPDECDKPKANKGTKLTMQRANNNPNHDDEQLATSTYQTKNSTTSGSSSTTKKKRWSSKILKRAFSRSSTNLQEA